MIKAAKIVFFWGLLLYSFAVQTQTISTYSFNEEYGFPEKTIYSVLQSEDGMIWIGTSNGVYRFDGRKFKKFFNPAYDLDYNNLKLDKWGRLWFSNFGGQLFYIENDSIKVVLTEPIDQGFVFNYFVISKNEIVFFSSRKKKLRKLNIDQQETEVIYTTDRQEAITNAKETEENEIYFFKSNNSTKVRTIFRYRLNKERLQIEKIDSVKMEYISSKELVLSIGKRLFYSQCHKGVEIVEFGNEEPVYFHDQLRAGQIINTISNLNDDILIMDINGVHRGRLVDGQLKMSSWSKVRNASCVFEDHEGNIWFATLGNGIFIAPTPDFRSQSISPIAQIGPIKKLNSSYYYISENGYLHRVNPKTFEVEKLLSEKFNPNFTLGADPYRKLLLFPTKDFFFDTKNDQFIPKPESHYFKRVKYLAPGLRLLTNLRLYLVADDKDFDLKEIQYALGLNSYRRTEYFEAIGPLQRCNLIVEEPNKKHLYINYIDGLHHFDQVGNQEVVLYQGEVLRVKEVCEDSKNGVWLASNSGDLHLLLSGKVVETISLNETVNKMIVNDSLIYAATNSGIYRIHKKTKSKTLIDPTDGLISEEIQSLHFEKEELWVWGNHTLQCIPLTYSDENEFVPLVRITDLIVNDEKQEIGGNLVFNHDQNTIEFQFQGMSIRSRKQLSYYFRIKELMPNWESTTYEAPIARFSNLAPGNYTFELKACNQDGLCSDVYSMSFQIKKPFYLRWWFILIILVLLLSISFTLVSLRFRGIRKRNQLEKEKETFKLDAYKAKITAIRAQMNPHFIFNALNTIQEFIFTNQSRIATEYLADFADLMRKYLSQSNQDQITLQEELETLEIYLRLENLRFGQDMQTEVEVSKEIDTFTTQIPVMLIQPFVENAIKHGLLHREGKKYLKLSFSKHGTSLVIKIEDNGIGRKASQEINQQKKENHKSFASGAIQQRIELINQTGNHHLQIDYLDVYDENGIASGTQVLIRLDL